MLRTYPQSHCQEHSSSVWGTQREGQQGDRWRVRELAAVFDELNDEHDSEAERSESGGNEDGVGGDDDEDEDMLVDDDNVDGLPDELFGMSQEELTSLEDSVKPIRLVLTKVSKFKLLF